MPRQAGPSGMRFVDEFVCRGCGAQEVYRSRPRGFFEKYVLPLFLLRTVRCAGCFKRSYALRTIAALDPVQPHREQPS